MVFKKSFNLLVATRTTPFFAVVSIMFAHDSMEIFFDKFQGVGSVKCKVFSLKIKELTPSYDLKSKFSVSYHF